MSETDSDRRVVDLLMEALELEIGERRRFLDKVCAGEPELREELEELLAEEEQLDEKFLEVPAVAGLGDTPLIPDDESGEATPAPDQVGPYSIVETLGRGGMGVVYLGEQVKPIRRRVALKVIEAIHEPERLRRFAAECQALARLGHPNIASLYEVGTTEDEHPFVAMELVEGVAITEWCDQRGLDLHQRIRLFFGACAGVRHAHEKGLLHRDIKPSNILVTEVDGRPVAKVIDFGIARAVDEPLITDVRMTLTHQILGSPGYMSPEAARFGHQEIDTRSDVYSLGVVLYELLAGVLPIETEGVPLFQIMTRLLEEDPPAASVRFAGVESARQQRIAAQRKTSVRLLTRRLRGDLDAILSKAVARDREHRYGSPADLAADLERHLDRAPVDARSSSATYLLGRFLRRHSQITTVVVALIFALAVGVVARTHEARRASLEARRALAAQAEAQEVAQFLVELFEVADPERRLGEPVDVRQLLDRGAERLRGELLDQPLVRARLLQTIGEIYTKMAVFDSAEESIAEALEIRSSRLADDHPDLLDSVNQLGVVYRRQGRLDEAEPLLRRVLAAREGAAEPDQEAIALALNNLGNLLWSQRRLEEAEAVQRRALQIRERALGSGHEDLAETLNNLGAILMAQRRYAEAQTVLQRSADVFGRTMGKDHPRYGAGLFNLGQVEEDLGQWPEAENHLRQALEIWTAAYGAEHPRTLMARTSLGSLLTTLGRESESAEVLRDLLAAQERTGADDRVLAATSTSLGKALAGAGRFGEARDSFERVLSIYLAEFGEEHDSTLRARADLAWLAWRRGRLRQAEEELREVLEARRRILGPEHNRTAWTMHYLAVVLAARGADGEAELVLREALRIREATRGEAHREVGDTLLELGQLVARRGSDGEARELLRRAHAIYLDTVPRGHRDLRRAAAAVEKLGR